ncbi:OprD family outer membrane porin [Spartinivicinus poritis]|uniref:OprD family outer membrane porin n=1 Tax=Spartinivicinus poritis TaxID=2994640 RepID=A0ABT5UL94_9GAMM|nr:OprD family outer membrane porin [Spartinivicinus sp. A2-2]MDE1465809.1 OprD family outer membrane porin [Spartinivicinus sp. A2-2]
MRPFKCTALYPTILALFSFDVYAGENLTNHSKLNVLLRNVYFNRDGRDQDEYDNREWVQGLQVNFNSDYFADIIGFDASYYSAWELDSNGSNFTHLPVDKSSKYTEDSITLYGETNDISLLGQAYVKLKFGDDHLNFNLKHGRMRHDNNLIQGSNSRAIPSSVYGTTANINIHDLTLYGTYLTQGSWRNMGHFEHFKAGNKDINYIQNYGLAYELDNGLGFEYDIGESNSYLKGQQYKVYYSLNLTESTQLYLEGIHHQVNENGHVFVTIQSNIGTTNADGYKAKNTSFQSRLTIDQLTLKAAYQFTKDGDFLYDWDANSGYGGYNSVIPFWSDYAYKDEKATLIGFEYNFAKVGIPGLSLDASYRKGFGLDRNNNGIKLVHRAANEWGRAMTTVYEFQSPPLAGLKFKWVNFTHRSSRSLGNEDIDGNQVYLDYTFSIF